MLTQIVFHKDIKNHLWGNSLEGKNKSFTAAFCVFLGSVGVAQQRESEMDSWVFVWRTELFLNVKHTWRQRKKYI